MGHMDSTDFDEGGRPQGLRVDTRHLPGRDAFALWQEQFVPHWEVRPVQSPREKFQSSTEIHQFGDIVLGTVETPAQWIDRSRYRIARDGFTQFGIQIVRQGRIGRRDGGSDAVAKEPGDLLVSDLAQCSALEASDLSTIFLSVPRDALAPLLAAPDHHNQRVISGRGPLATLLKSHLLALHEQAAHMGADAVPTVMETTLGLTAAVLNAEVTEAEAGAVMFALTLEIRRHVDRRVADRHLSAEAVAGQFGISLRKLYYLFEPFGGFAGYVRERRLHRVREALANPMAPVRSIAEIADETGFGNYAGFVRAFRKTFGISPRELRILARERRWTGRAPDRGSTLNDWLLQTR